MADASTPPSRRAAPPTCRRRCATAALRALTTAASAARGAGSYRRQKTASVPLVPAQAGTQNWIPACAGMSGEARILPALRCPDYWLARHHHARADADAIVQIGDVGVMHADAAVRHEFADRAFIVGAVDGVLAAAGQRHGRG